MEQELINQEVKEETIQFEKTTISMEERIQKVREYLNRPRCVQCFRYMEQCERCKDYWFCSWCNKDPDYEEDKEVFFSKYTKRGFNGRK